MRRSIAWRGLSFLILSVLLVAGEGCSEATGIVSGEVKLNGDPVPRGTITFHSRGSKPTGRFTEINDGKYTLAGLPVGEYAVTVQSTIQPPPTTAKGAKAKTPAPKTVPVPLKYSDPEKSGLTFTLKAGDNTYSPTLEGDAAPPKK
jgi:hypothetical protein